jgi:DNA topoisomerase-1
MRRHVHIHFHDLHAFFRDEFNKADHPQAPAGAPGGTGGEFLPKGKSASGGKMQPAPAERKDWPAHIRKLAVPPGWQNVRFASDPKADKLVSGTDSKGRPVGIYSAAFRKKKDAVKFRRVRALDRKHEQVVRQNERNMRSRDPAKRENAACQNLIMTMGLRPGSERDTGAETKAYGATNLQGQHVKTEDGRTVLEFTGKKGVKLKLPVTDDALAEDLQARARKAGPNGLLFDTDDGKLRRYVKTLGGGGFKVKDFRTYIGTSTAADLVAKGTAPTTVRAYKKSVMEVAKKVAEKLGNTASVALKAYISPMVFAGWKEAANVA